MTSKCEDIILTDLDDVERDWNGEQAGRIYIYDVYRTWWANYEEYTHLWLKWNDFEI